MAALSISLIQTSLHWEDKGKNLFALQNKIEKLRGSTHVVVLPEMFSTGFSMKPETLAETMEGPSVQWMKTTAQQNRVILTGSLIIEENGHYYNRLIWMQPNGQYGYYDKRHLFAFAGEDQHYTAGSKRLIASVNGWKVNLQVCYDLRFPVWARQSSRQISEEDLTPQPPLQEERGSVPAPHKNSSLEYDLLIYVANWPKRRSLAWKTLLQARAIENQCYVVGVNRVGEDGNGIYHSGDSRVIDPLGEVLYQKADEEDMFTITLQKESLEEVRRKFPFWRDGDDFEMAV